MRYEPSRNVVPPEVDWDEELWELTWERRLDQVERHHLGWTVLRGRLPDDDAFYAAVGRELARRWRRTLALRSVGWLFWVGFWLLMLRAVTPGGPAGLPMGMVGVGVGVIGTMLWVRGRLCRPIEEADRRIRAARGDA